MTFRPAAVCALALVGVAVTAQDRQFFYPAPDASAIEVSKDVAYGALRMDLYRPAGVATPLPALIFFNIAAGAERGHPFYQRWGEIAAAHGMTAILPDLGDDSFAEDFDALAAHLAADAGRLRIDRNRIGVYAGSGNVYRALPLVQDPKRTLVRSAVMYYGSAQVAQFRRDLPLLLVRAGLDRPPVNRALTSLAALAVTQNAPVTLLNYPAGHHAFEMVDDRGETGDVIDRTIEFIERTTTAAYQASLRQGLIEATAAAHVATGDFKQAAAAYSEMVKARGDDATLRLAYGEALLGDAQYGAACAEFEKLKGKRLGPRDLGVPAARACMQHGEAESAIAWLQSIPPQYRPRDLEKDPVFAAIQDRPAFKALFQPAR